VPISKVTFGETQRDEPFMIERVKPEGVENELSSQAIALRGVLLESWIAKFVPNVLDEEDVKKKIPNAWEMQERVNSPDRDVHYWLAYSSWRSINPVGMLCVEAYKPRNPFTKSYPNVTDLETIDGSLRGFYSKQATALLYFGLTDYEDGRKVAVYSEEPNPDGIAFMEEIGFSQTGNKPTEKIGSSVMTYVHLEAGSVSTVRTALLERHGWLEEGY